MVLLRGVVTSIIPQGPVARVRCSTSISHPSVSFQMHLSTEPSGCGEPVAYQSKNKYRRS